jgi:hypothetical protein
MKRMSKPSYTRVQRESKDEFIVQPEGFPTKIVCGSIEFTSGGRKIKENKIN